MRRIFISPYNFFLDKDRKSIFKIFKDLFELTKVNSGGVFSYFFNLGYKINSGRVYYYLSQKDLIMIFDERVSVVVSLAYIQYVRFDGKG